MSFVSKAKQKRRQRKKSSTSLKSLDKTKHFLEEVRLTYCKYPVPKFLYRSWTDKAEEEYQDWFKVVGAGHSLYKKCSKGVLTKKGTFYFLKAPNDLTITQNIWWARVRSFGGNEGVAYRIAKSRIGEQCITDEFWISVARFFMVNNVPMKELSELLDFIRHAYATIERFSMKGRTLQSVQRLSYAWHKEMHQKKDYKKLQWTGADFSNGTFTTGKDEHKKRWIMKQLLTSAELVSEGSAMRHCVGGYASSCANGGTSIWSLSTVDTFGQHKRSLTIEMRGDQVVQMRGRANRLCRPDEKAVVEKWAWEVGAKVSNNLW